MCERCFGVSLDSMKMCGDKSGAHPHRLSVGRAGGPVFLQSPSNCKLTFSPTVWVLRWWNQDLRRPLLRQTRSLALLSLTVVRFTSQITSPPNSIAVRGSQTTARHQPQRKSLSNDLKLIFQHSKLCIMYLAFPAVTIAACM